MSQPSPPSEQQKEDLLSVLALVRLSAENKSMVEIHETFQLFLNDRTPDQVAELLWISADLTGMILQDIYRQLGEPNPTPSQVLDRLVQMVVAGELGRGS